MISRLATRCVARVGLTGVDDPFFNISLQLRRRFAGCPKPPRDGVTKNDCFGKEQNALTLTAVLESRIHAYNDASSPRSKTERFRSIMRRIANGKSQPGHE